MAKGFFTKAQVDSQKRMPPKGRGKSLDCDSCGLFKGALSPRMDMKGQGKKGILFIGEAPGVTEDEDDDIFVGKSGDLLRRSLKRVGINLEEDACRINAANCWPGRTKDGKSNATPTNHHIACCRQVKVMPAIVDFKPRHIVLMGKAALQSFYGTRHSKLYINKFRGQSMPDPVTGAWVHVLFHPSFALRKKHDNNLQALWKRDLKRLASHLNWDPPEIPDPASEVQVLQKMDQVMVALAGMRKADWIAFDWETSGLLPYAPGHKILSMAITAHFPKKPFQTISFPISYPGAWTKKEQRAIINAAADLLEDPVIGKVAHNLKFEDMWARVRLGVRVEGWLHCTMVGEHILNNTPGVTGLKHIGWVKYGVEDYDTASKKFISAVPGPDGKKPGNHGINRLEGMPLHDLLLYGGIDSRLTAWEYQRQAKAMRGTGLRKAYNFFHEALLALADIQDRGVPVDVDYYINEGKVIQEEMETLHDKIMRSREAKLFHQKAGKPLDYGATDDLKKLLFDYLGKKPPKETTGGNASVDAEVLGIINIPITKNIIQKRKLAKMKDPYFEQHIREAHNGKLYPFINLHTTRTYRSSMDGPNLQNVPNRDPEAKMRVRRGLGAPPGFKLMEPDYGGIEVCGVAWYSKDPAILKYLHTPGADMHRDQTQTIFKIDPKMWDKLDKGVAALLRFHIKGMWVFAQIYGSWYKQCAANIWKVCADLPIGDGEGTTVRQHLGISFSQFEDFMRRHEAAFWDEYKGVRRWQDSVAEEYQAKGYIETFLGFRMGGWMTRNQLYNGKIQGTAFHVLLWDMMQLHYESIERGWRTHVMWQIHDSMPTALWPEEEEEVVRVCKDIMTVQAPKKFPWINTPLKVDFEMTETDGTYADLAKYQEGREGFSDLEAEN